MGPSYKYQSTIFHNEVLATLGIFFKSDAQYIGLEGLFRKSDIVHNFYFLPGGGGWLFYKYQSKNFPNEVFATLGIFFRVRSTVYRPGGASPEKRFRFQFISEAYGIVPTSTSRNIFPNKVFSALEIFFVFGAPCIGLEELFWKSDIVYNFF